MVKNLEQKGLLVRNPASMHSRAGHTAHVRTHVLHGVKYAPPVKLSGHQLFVQRRAGQAGADEIG